MAVSQETSSASRGAFDITLAPLIALWGFGPQGEPSQLPNEVGVHEVQMHTGFGLLEVRRESPDGVTPPHPAAGQAEPS